MKAFTWYAAWWVSTHFWGIYKEKHFSKCPVHHAESPKSSMKIFWRCAYVTELPTELYYIGLRDVTGNNVDYKWTRDGDNLNFTNWNNGQPNFANERCVTVFSLASIAGKWFDSKCDGTNGGGFFSVCETDKVSKLNWETLKTQHTISTNFIEWQGEQTTLRDIVILSKSM